MKILQLRLLAFGPFTDTLLDLNNGQEGLHIVYGPNEAGKSSALRGLRYLLYGIPLRCSDDFIHPYANLRIGGALRRSDGTVLEFVRRKGRTNTLRELDDATVIDESQLRRSLGDVDADLFTTMFGIDHTDLVRGGEEIIQGGGELGQVLFSAGSGISDLRKVQDELQAEADDLFKPSGSKPRINEAVARFKDRQKAMREAQLPSQEWDRHDQALREAFERKQSVDRDLSQRERERARLERIKEALPIIVQRRELLGDLEPCADAVLLPPDFRDRRGDALTNLRIAEKEEAQALESLEEIKQALEELDVPEPLLEHTDLIEQLHQDLGSHRKAMKDRSRLVVQRDGLEADAMAILRELDGDLTLDNADQLRLGKAESVRIQELGSLHERLVTRSESTREEITKLSLRIKLLKEQLAELEAPPDVTELRGAIERARQQGALEERYQAECGDIRQAEQEADVALEKQALWNGTLEAFEKLPVPSFETIDTFERRLDEVEGTVTKQCADIEELERADLRLEGQIEQLQLEQEVPTEDDLREARRKRNEGWQLIRRAWNDGHEPGKDKREFVATSPRAEDLAEAYEFSVQRADELADRLRREADRVAKLASLLAERETCKNQRIRLNDQLQTGEAERTRIQEEWFALWVAIGISPMSPREMRTWAQNQAALAGQVSVIRQRNARADDLKTRIETYRRELSGCLERLGEPPAEADETLIHLLERSQQTVECIDQLQSKHEQLAREIEQHQGELLEARSRGEKAEQELSQWRSNWAEAIQSLRLDADASPSQANAVVEDLKDLFDKLKEAEGLSRRIEGIDRDAEEFAGKVRRLVEREAPDLVESPVEQAAAELNTRLTRARKAKTEQQSLEQQSQQEEERLRSARIKIAEINAQLDTMCQEARCENYEALPEAEERSARRQEIQTQLKQLDEQLRKLSAGATLDEFVQDAQSVDPDDIQSTVDRLTEEIDQLGQQKSELDQTIGGERTELSKMDGSAQAAELAEEVQGLLAHLDTDVQQYVRLRLASVVLSQAIEAYRQKNQGPILKRSEELFAQMTLGSFEGLRVEVNDEGNPLLVGVRRGGKEIVGVEGMSDGTTDQLYLAVRLASLEMYLERNEPIPFIVDDILIKFDDDRATAALQVLAQLSERTQVIFFTHHRRLVELAEAHVDSSVLFTHSIST